MPQAQTLRSWYVPRLFESHFTVVKGLLQSSEMPIFVTANETTDTLDKSVLNVLASIKGTRYLIDVEQMEAACNHSISAKLLLRPFQTQAFHLTRLVES